MWSVYSIYPEKAKSREIDNNIKVHLSPPTSALLHFHLIGTPQGSKPPPLVFVIGKALPPSSGSNSVIDCQMYSYQTTNASLPICLVSLTAAFPFAPTQPPLTQNKAVIHRRVKSKMEWWGSDWPVTLPGMFLGGKTGNSRLSMNDSQKGWHLASGWDHGLISTVKVHSGEQ